VSDGSAPAEIERLLLAPSFFEDPYPVYRRLREDFPVYWSEGLQAWMISRHADVSALLRDTVRLSNFGWEGRHLARLDEPTRARVPELLVHHETPSILTSDPPFHTKLRKSVIKGFTPTAIERVWPRVEQLVHQLLDQRAAPDTFDLIATLAYPLPATVVAELLGVPAEDREDFKRWSVSLTTFFGAPAPDPALAERCNRDLIEFRGYLRALLAARHRDPRDDVASVFAADEYGLELTEEEAIATMAAFLVAGHETTTNVIGNGMFALLKNPAAMEQARSGDTSPAAVIEETLRYDPPVQRVRRTARTEIELHGLSIEPGSTVMLLIGSANRDSTVYRDADVFDATRQGSPHLAFGLGPHFCVGAGLARLEAPIAISAVLEASARIRLAQGWAPQWYPSMTLRGLRSLDLRLGA
jgi:cytochrome P450